MLLRLAWYSQNTVLRQGHSEALAAEDRGRPFLSFCLSKDETKFPVDATEHQECSHGRGPCFFPRIGCLSSLPALAVIETPCSLTSQTWSKHYFPRPSAQILQPKCYRRRFDHAWRGLLYAANRSLKLSQAPVCSWSSLLERCFVLEEG